MKTPKPQAPDTAPRRLPKPAGATVPRFTVHEVETTGSVTLPSGNAAVALRWQAADGAWHDVLWHAENGAAAPRRVVQADDQFSADAAYRLACEGTALLWTGDFHNARQLLQALARRFDAPPRGRRKAEAPLPYPQRFHRYRMAQAQRARVLGQLLVPLQADHTIALRRAPDVR
ncbi:MAG: hypothetical protein QM617_03680, partial [Comamonas sp.]